MVGRKEEDGSGMIIRGGATVWPAKWGFERENTVAEKKGGERGGILKDMEPLPASSNVWPKVQQ